jgi:coenzyme A diphosphatase NUDT7
LGVQGLNALFIMNIHEKERMDMKEASVMVPFQNDTSDPSILFEIRQQAIAQGGDICFPGGQKEEGETAQETAVRETCEELLIHSDQVRDVLPLFDIKGPGGIPVHVFRCHLEKYHNTYGTSEIEKVFTMPLSWFLNHEPSVC